MSDERTAARLLLAAVLSLSLVACNHGTRPHQFRPATMPVGAAVAVRVRGEAADRLGELYAADSAGIIVAEKRVTRIPWSSLEAMDLDRLGDRYDVLHGETPSAEKRSRIALVSRFPQGLSDELLARVLAAHGQPALEHVP